MRRRGAAASEVCRVFEPLPQRLRNCRSTAASRSTHAEVRRCIAAAERGSAGAAGCWSAPSGTEPVIRVMVEAEDETLLASVLDEVAGTIERYA